VAGSWWQVNLNRRVAISSINLHNREDCCQERLRDVTVTVYGTDGTTVVHASPVLNPNNTLGSPLDLVYDLAAVNGGNPVFGQYVRISRTRDPAATLDDAVVLSLGEVQVLGTELNGYRPYIRTDVQAAMKDVTAEAFWRLPFTVANPSQLNGLSLRMRYDDGFIAYLNGVEVARRNAPGAMDRPFPAGLNAETIDLMAHISSLTAGSNVLAIHGINSSAGDDNFLLQPSLTASMITETPNVYLVNATPATLDNSPWYIEEVADTVFSHRRGFYETAFNLSISTVTPGASIYYTLDNSEPTTSSTLYTGPISIASPTGSYSGTRVVRARAFKTNWKSTNIDTHTYIFLANVMSQTKGTLTTAGAATGTIPAGWPTNAATNGGQAFNFGFTPAVTASYTAQQLREGLTQIPSLSVVTQQSHLTNPSTGIYVNGTNGHGETWERPGSVEFLDISKPGATPEAGHGQFSENCGLRLRGGASRADTSVKHSFRVFFRTAYGSGKLNYRLYGADGAAQYDTFDLRGSQNYTWANNGADTQETLVRDPFCRELLGAMGQQWTRSRFVHLYLNGLYWGIFEIHERPENSYGETYLGGNKDNYDVVKNKDRYSGIGFSTEATDGYLQTNPDNTKAAWRDLWDRCKDVKANPTTGNYFRLLGRNADGTRNPAYPVLLDVDNLIDYTMALFYSGDGDACLSGFLSFNTPNNWHGMRDRLGSRGFTFFNHDAEHTLRASSWAGSRAVATNDQTGPYGGTNQNNFTFSNPQWMHEELMSSPEYRLRYADHIRRHLFNNGALTPNKAIARWNDRAGTITKAIVPYAGRYASAATAITTWKNLCGIPGDSVNGAGVIDNIPLDFLAMRTNLADLANSQNLLRMLTADGLWPALAPADFSQHGGSVAAGYPLSVSGPAGAQIYYTTDGSDPRAVRAQLPTPLTYLSAASPTRYFITTSASGGDTGFTSAPIPQPSPGPVSRYPLNGNANDAVGTNNGTLSNAPTFGVDRGGNASSAVVLNGTNQAVTLGNPTNLQITGPITIAAWVYPTQSNGTRNIVNKGHNTTPNGEITLRCNAGTLEGGAWNGTTYSAALTGGITLNTWQHVVSVYDGTAWRLYKNGAQVAVTVSAVGAVSVAGTTAANNAWNIGSRGGAPGERAFAGSIDDVAIFNRGLSANEVLALYNPSELLITADWKNPAWAVPTSWGTANGGIGYDAEPTISYSPFIVQNVQSAMQGQATSVLTRKDFTLTATQVADTGYLQLNVRYDDGFVAYLNGVKVAERNAPVNTSGTSAATAARGDELGISQEFINLTAFKANLTAGNNVLAIQGLNQTAADNDFLLEAELVAADVATTAAAPLTAGAQLYTGPVPLNTPTTVKTRVFQNGEWSALTEAFFSVAAEPASASNLVVSELHYHPENPSTAAELAVSADKDEYEFIELANISATASVDLTGIRLTAGVTTTALGNYVLLPGQRAVYVRNPAAFAVRYPNSTALILGAYSGSLNNQGEQIVLNAANGSVIKDFSFDDNPPWPEAADGLGMSLVLIDPMANPNHSLAGNWRASVAVGGTPGTSSYAQWKAAYSQNLDSDDGDHDGLDARLEYALATQPGTADNALPLASTVEAGFLTFTLRHRIADDLMLTPEVSSTLVNWTTAGVTLLETNDQGDGTTISVWQAPAAMAAEQRVFFRVTATVR
jgi:hypothetical protein